MSSLASLDLDRLRPTLHRYCARMVGSALEGEDIVQEAMLRAIGSMPTERPIDNPAGWLFRIAHNLALDYLRQRSRLSAMHADDDIEAMAHPADEQGRRDAAAAALPVFMQMPASQRSVVILFDVLEYSAQEVSEILDTTVPAVKSILQRGRERLRGLARQPPPANVPAPLSAGELQLLNRYVELFNNRDFDTLRTMLAADVRLDLVNRLQLHGPAVGEYFTRYGQTSGWKAWPGQVEGQAALLIRQQERQDGPPDYCVVLGWSDGQVATIRDFLFARHVMAELAPAWI